MKNKLVEEMLKAGLVSEDEVRQKEHKQRQEKKKVGDKEQRRRSEATKEEARREREAQRERDKARGREEAARLAEKERAHHEAQQRQAAIESAFRDGKLSYWEGSRQYYFVDGKRVEFLMVSDDVAKRLEQGRAAIVRGDTPAGGYTVLTASAAEKLQSVAPDTVVAFHRPEERA